MYKKLLVALSFSCILGIPFLSLMLRPAKHMSPPPPRHRVEPPAPPVNA